MSKFYSPVAFGKTAKTCGKVKEARTSEACAECILKDTDESDISEDAEKGCRRTAKSSEPRILFRPVSVEPVFKGIYKDPIEDLAGLRVVEKGVRKGPWSEDYTAVMQHFGALIAPEEDAPQQLIFGYANVTVDEDGQPPLDYEGDIIKTEDLEMAAYNYTMNSALAGIEHNYDTECGWLIESMMFTKDKMAAMGIPEGIIPEGWWTGFYIPDPAVYKKVVDGEFNMFSIQGRGRRIPLDSVDEEGNIY